MAQTTVVWAALSHLRPPDALPSSRSTLAGGKEVTPIADIAYPTVLLTLYAGLPDTPRRPSSYDKTLARSLWERRVPLDIIEAAMLLGSLRRLRPPGVAPLPRIRSLAYFSPLIDELQQQPMPAGYLDYLRHKARQAFPQTAVSQPCPSQGATL